MGAALKAAPVAPKTLDLRVKFAIWNWRARL
jgi:hypothetical protein